MKMFMMTTDALWAIGKLWLLAFSILGALMNAFAWGTRWKRPDRWLWLLAALAALTWAVNIAADAWWMPVAPVAR